VEYDQAGQGTSHLCKCGEFLNTLLKGETFKALKHAEADLRIYPDMAMVTLRDQKPGCLESLLAKAPEPLRILLKIVLFPIILLFAMPSLLIGIPVMICTAAVAVILLVSFPFILIPAILVLAALSWACNAFERWRISRVAKRVIQEPKGPFGVKMLYKYSPLVPRIWVRGDRVGEVMEIVRVNTRSKFVQRALILVILDNTFGKDGCFSMGVGVLIGRLLSKRRRVYVLAMDGGEPVADAAATALAKVLGVPVRQGSFSMKRLAVK